MKVTQHLWFEKDMEATIRFYVSLEAGPLDPFNHSFSIIVECDTLAEIDRRWDALKEGGATGQCGWLRDRWGLSWQTAPRGWAS